MIITGVIVPPSKVFSNQNWTDNWKNMDESFASHCKPSYHHIFFIIIIVKIIIIITIGKLGYFNLFYTNTIFGPKILHLKKLTNTQKFSPTIKVKYVLSCVKSGKSYTWQKNFHRRRLASYPPPLSSPSSLLLSTSSSFSLSLSLSSPTSS